MKRVRMNYEVEAVIDVTGVAAAGTFKCVASLESV